MITRRTFSASLLTAGLTAAELQTTPARAVAADGSTIAACRTTRRWKGPLCQSSVTNTGKTPVRLREIVLFEGPHGYPPQTPFYGEGFTMLSQTGGTLGQPEAIGGYLDSKHYRIPEPEGAVTVYGATCISPASDRHELMAFTSSRRFVGRFHFRPETVQATLDCEGLELGPGQSWELEEFTRLTGRDRAQLFAQLGGMIAKNHPPPRMGRAAGRLVLLVLLWRAGDRAAGAR